MRERPSVDDLVCSQQHRWRDGEAERLRGPDVYDELELGRLLDWEVGRFGALEDLVGVAGGAAIGVRIAHTLGHDAACYHVLARAEGRGKSVPCC